MKRLLVFGCLVLGLFQATAAVAQWSVTEDGTSPYKVASVVSPEGRTFAVFRKANGTVWGRFRLSDADFRNFSAERLPVLKVDEYESLDFQPSNPLRESSPFFRSMYETGSRTVELQLWYGKSSEGLSKFIAQLMTGKSLLVRYCFEDSKAGSSQFSLSGAKEALDTALNLELSPSELGTALTAEPPSLGSSPEFRRKLAELRKQEAAMQPQHLCAVRSM